MSILLIILHSQRLTSKIAVKTFADQNLLKKNKKQNFFCSNAHPLNSVEFYLANFIIGRSTVNCGMFLR